MWLIAGLGNPGRKYEQTRHNAGFLVVDRLLARHGRGFAGSRFEAHVGEIERDGQRLLVLKPQTWMNESGRSLAAALRFYKASITQVIVVHDEVDLDFGELRLKAGGGAGGHNGLKSATQQLGGQDYRRLRVGIGRPPGSAPGEDLTRHVLGRFSGTEASQLDGLLDEAVDRLECVVGEGIPCAMNRYNGRGVAKL